MSTRKQMPGEPTCVPPPRHASSLAMLTFARFFRRYVAQNALTEGTFTVHSIILKSYHTFACSQAGVGR